MSNSKIPAKKIAARLRTVEERLEDVVGRIGLLDEQARQAGYHAQLAIEQWGRYASGVNSPASDEPEPIDQIARLEAILLRLGRRVEKLRER